MKQKSHIHKVVLPVGALLLLAGAVSFGTAKFDEFGNNKTAGVFNGTGMSWCMGKFNDLDFCNGYLGGYANDKLVMKWNAEWDRGNAEGWANPPYSAWLLNQWNGKNHGSGAIWHYRYKWHGFCQEGELLPSGGYCIWGQFEVLADHGSDPSVGPGHLWYSHAKPAGFGN